MRRIIFPFIASLFWQYSYGQWFNNITTFTTQNGLSNNTITCLQKDEAGFLWIGTHEGLNRYDGTEFINVLSNSRNNLPSNNINKIAFINKNLLAVATDAGLCLLNTATLKGKRIDLPFNEKFASSGYYIEDLLYEKNKKQLWVGSWHGLFILNEEGILQQKIMAPEENIGKRAFVKLLLRDVQQQVYFYSAQQTIFCYPVFEKGTTIAAEKRSPWFSFNDSLRNGYYVRSAYMAGDDCTIIISKFETMGTSEYIFYYNILTKRTFKDKLIINSIAEKRVSNAFRLNDSIFLLNSYFGEPMLYNSNDHQVRLAADHPLWFMSWPDGFGSFILKDDNNIWIATTKGLLQSSEKATLFRNNPALIKKINDNHGGLVSYNYAIYDSSKLWVACMGAGLFGYDSSNNNIQDIFNNTVASDFSSKKVSTAVLPAGQSLWLFSVYGPAQINKLTQKISFVDGHNKDSLFDGSASYPLKDSKGNIWTTIPNGIAQYNIASATFTNHKSKYLGGNFPLLRAGPKTEDGKGNIWMARQDTLVKYDPQKQSFSIFFIRKDNRALRPVTSIASDGGDLLYVSVQGSFGIYHISTGAIDLFTKQTGIISTAINKIVSDDDGNAWIATEGGLIFYNKQKMKFSSYTKADGLPDDEVKSLNFADTQKKTLFLGFSKTYYLFEPASFLIGKTVPANNITSIEVDGQLYTNDSGLYLSYNQNSISFSYTGINFNQGQQNNYACMLQGFDHDWKYTGSERKINYINLPPGKYTFKVKSANHQGEWNEQPAMFSFEIAAPFWQRWWFISLVIALVALCLYYYTKKREAAIKKENSIKLQMSELRMQALRAQMNPHFIFNSLNSIQNYILSNNTIDAASYLSKFAKLMRRILDQSKHNFLPLGEVMDTLKMYVEIEAFRFNNEFSYVFDVEDNDDLLDTRVPPMLLQPFVENAILHGLMPKAGNKRLFISCSVENNSVEIIIDDNGIGRTQHQPKAGHESQGEKLTTGMLESMQQLQHIKATIQFTDKKENEKPAGTTVTFIIPLK